MLELSDPSSQIWCIDPSDSEWIFRSSFQPRPRRWFPPSRGALSPNLCNILPLGILALKLLYQKLLRLSGWPLRNFILSHNGMGGILKGEGVGDMPTNRSLFQIW